ncbi:inositol monophosphatase family protein [Tasmannia lanceolata]|uniref:inositol monophosphatase family protein n=1 Tax=Tasmannia lanceolata TaxID=3420 RepID=UPI0040639C1F
MKLLHSSPCVSSIHRFNPLNSSTPLRRSSRFFTVRSSLPFTPEKAKYFKELEAAVDVVHKACRLCVDVQKSLFSGGILEKNDETPVTIADFSVQALISLELYRSFPTIPLVAEEDSTFLRSNSINSEQEEACDNNFLVGSMLSAVTDKVTVGEKTLTCDDILEAIDRGGKDAYSFGEKPATYWVLDPIDGTKGFLKDGPLYVVGLALIVEGEMALGVMGCPNWKERWHTEGREDKIEIFGSGTVMISHVGCGTWTKRFSDMLNSMAQVNNGWVRCHVDNSRLVHEARFCLSDSQTWESLPLSVLYSSTTDADSTGDEQKVLILPKSLTCCGSLSKYFMVASGRASAFIFRNKPQVVIKAWDHAVGILCVHEAGGQVTDWKGNQFDLAADKVARRSIFPSTGILASNGYLHGQILEMISANSLIV